MNLYRGITREYSPDFPSNPDDLSWWGDFDTAVIYTGRRTGANLLSIKSDNLKILQWDDELRDKYGDTDSFISGCNKSIIKYLRDNGYDGLSWQERNATWGILPESLPHIIARPWYAEPEDFEDEE